MGPILGLDHVQCVDPAFRPPRKAHLCFLVLGERYEELRDTLRSRGVDVLEDDRIEGARRFFTRDPWGNRLEFRVA
jgi:hypothetical protein